MKVRLRSIAVAIAFATAVLAVLVTRSTRPNAPSSMVMFEPPVVELQDAVREGVNCSATVHICNRSSETAYVESVAASCSCTDIVGPDGAICPKEFQLAPGEMRRLEIRTNTNGVSGVRELRVGMRGLVGDNRFDAISTVRVHVMAGLRAVPDSTVIQPPSGDNSASAEVTIADGYPDPGISIKSVRVSRPDRLRADLRPVSIENAIILGETGWKARYQLFLHCDVADDNQDVTEEFVDLVPEDTTAHPLRVRVLCQPVRPLVSLVPQSLVVECNAYGDLVTRKVRCVLEGISADRLAVLRKPDWVAVRIDEGSPNEKTIALEWKVSEPSHLKPFELVFGDPHTGESFCALPVIVHLLNTAGRGERASSEGDAESVGPGGGVKERH